ncbi:MAG: acetyl-CoA carboxylase biotin carboxylase subunit [Melioribacteraceae bacterium]|nr:acetyl-CoA carboxylase biotin carboxylase subunit [Melioribacteraceae bacterium]
MKKIEKILIANRGEISVRIQRTCRELGIKTVAIFSEQDKSAFHVQYAEESFALGGTALADTYLNQDKIIEITKKSGADAIHPGYGFLSENSEFARKCVENDIIYIGPDPDTIDLMGLKTESRKLMEKAGVPVVPGSIPLSSIEDVKTEAKRIGFPIIIKASAGGGGKGMRLVNVFEELEPAFDSCRREAQNSFGNPEVYMEKYITNIHHIEFQVIADHYGNVKHLYERDCSIQRRHQKIIEECPSTILTDELREEMGEIAILATKACNYKNAGTIEFILDDTGNFYFLEMNTRLQVEHPITEMITGLDLVAKQIKIAQGESIEDLVINRRGAAIECRIYAEDPENNFMPSPGKLEVYTIPAGFGVRNDTGVYSGYTIPMEYDPMISKLIVYAEDRARAIEKMQRALGEIHVLGIKTNISYLRKIILTDNFKEGKVNTQFIEEHEEELSRRPIGYGKNAIAAAAILKYEDMMGNLPCSKNGKGSAWKMNARREGVNL